MDFGSTQKRRGDSVVMWCKKNRYIRKANGEMDCPASNLNLCGFLGGVLCVPDGAYREFLTEYANEIAEPPCAQFLTECRGPTFRYYVDFDIVRPQAFSDQQIDTLAATIHATICKFTTADVSRCIMLLAPTASSDKGIKTGIHAIMPNLIVDRARALDARAALLASLPEAFPDFTMEEWVEAVDASVYNDDKSGLRMLGSNKVRACVVCRNASDKRKECTHCVYTGKEDVGRAYAVHAAYALGVRDDVLTAKLKANVHLAVRQTSIRVAAADAWEPKELTEWKRFVGCPALHVSDQKRSESQALRTMHSERVAPGALEFPDDKRGTAQFRDRVTVPRGDARISVMLSALHRLHKQYAKLEANEALFLPEQQTYLLKVRGTGSNYCLNRGGDHSSATVYFMFQPDREGTFHQRCFSRKETTVKRIDGLCRCWKSQKKRLSGEEYCKLWPNLNMQDVKFGVPKPKRVKAE